MSLTYENMVETVVDGSDVHKWKLNSGVVEVWLEGIEGIERGRKSPEVRVMKA